MQVVDQKYLIAVQRSFERRATCGRIYAIDLAAGDANWLRLTNLFDVEAGAAEFFMSVVDDRLYYLAPVHTNMSLVYQSLHTELGLSQIALTRTVGSHSCALSEDIRGNLKYKREEKTLKIRQLEAPKVVSEV